MEFAKARYCLLSIKVSITFLTLVLCGWYMIRTGAIIQLTYLFIEQDRDEVFQGPILQVYFIRDYDIDN